MQTFAKKKIALAVGAALVLMAGAAQAAGTNPTVRTGGIVATGMSALQAQSLYAATGYAGPITITVYLQPLADTVTPANSQAITDAGLLVNGQAVAGAGSANANNDFTVTYGATPVFFPVSAVGFAPNTVVGGTAAIAANAANAYAEATFTIAAVDVNGAFRINGANLEYTKDSTASPIVWNVVNVQGLTAAANPITTTDGAGAPANTFTSTAAPAVAGVVPTPTMTTHSTPTVAGGAKIDGLVINTFSPISVLTHTTNYKVTGVPAATTNCVGSPIAANDLTTSTVGGQTGALNTVLFPTPDTAPWTAAPAGDAAAYSTNCFNTGVTGNAVPFVVSLVPATLPTFLSIVNPASGAPAKLSALPPNAVITDGAPPVIVTTAAGAPTPARPGGTNLQLTFSEPMALIGQNDLREVLENVFIGSNSLGALVLNDSLNPTLSLPAALAGQSTLTINGLDGGELTPTSTVTVTQGITFKEANDTGASATVPAIDDDAGFEPSTGVYGDGGLVQLAGGIASATGAVEAASVTAKAVTPAVITVLFADAQCFAQTTAADPSKVGSITCTFPADRAISLANGLTTAALVNQIRVTVLSNDYGAPVSANDERYQFFPTAAQMTLNAAGTELKIALPTDLIYANVQTPTGMIVDYLGRVPSGTEGALVKASAATVPVPALKPTDLVAAGSEPVKMPLSASAGSTDGLVTQSIIGSFTTVTNGDRVSAFLAHWVATPAANPFATAPITGTVSSPASTSLAFDVASNSLVNVTNYVDAQNNAIKPAQPAVPGVSPDVPAVAAKPAPIYFVVKDGVAEAFFNSTSTTALALATIRSKQIIDEINVAAQHAGEVGSTATGADGSVINGNSSITTSSAAALASGDAAAAAEVIRQYFVGAKILPQAVMVAAANAAAAANATPASVVKAVLATINDYKVRTSSLDPVSGAITGAVTAKLAIKNATTTTAARGLVIDSFYNADGIVGTVNGVANSFNLLVGIDPANANLNALKSPAKFVILVHESAATGEFTMLTSADAAAANFVPFSANLLTGSGARTTLAPIVLANLKAIDEAPNAWTLVPLGNPAKKAAPSGYTASFDQMFVGLSGGAPQSTWTNDGCGTDMALAMVGNKATAASEQGVNKSTLSTITSSSYIAGASALAWKNDCNLGTTMFVMQGTPVAAKLPAGWSLVTTPSSGTFGAAVTGVINVGSQTTAPFTWITGDTGAPPVAGGDPVFVYSKAGGAL